MRYSATPVSREPAWRGAYLQAPTSSVPISRKWISPAPSDCRARVSARGSMTARLVGPPASNLLPRRHTRRDPFDGPGVAHKQQRRAVVIYLRTYIIRRPRREDIHGAT